MIFLANMWDGLLGERGLELLADSFGGVSGNWLSSPRQMSRPPADSRILLSPSVMGSAVTPMTAFDRGADVVAWVLFPDQLIGWDWQHQTYRHMITPVLHDTLLICRILAVNSEYAAGNLRQAGVDSEVSILPLGVDIHGIRAARDNRREETGVHVLWAHMWRSQKNPDKALRIAAEVLKRDPSIRVTIGRAGTWLDDQHSPREFREEVLTLARSLQAQCGDKVRFVEHLDSARSYWKLLSQVDISYSCSAEESFGVAMLEHAAAGAACVCPSTLCYPEVHPHACLVPPTETDIADAITELAGDPALLTQARSRSLAHAATYPIEATVRGIVQLFS
ncbi:glycosyltransferase family 4 protein [Micromonospora sp. LOL_021]|uniref:glycosyltransferase family 4 protein n=1 Tax=Micromonospora sp. LOL_021 TaxID=3345417 RepID=UPI003A867E01